MAKKPIKKKKRILKPRTRNAGTMTEAMFWTMIRSALRHRSRFWKPIALAKQKAKRKYKGPNRRQKVEYQCNECKNWFPDKMVSVDHIEPAGRLQCFNDIAGFVERLFCEVEGLQVLCDTCHDRKTKNEKENTKNADKK